MRRLSLLLFFFFQAEDGIRDLVRSRGLGDVYKRQAQTDEALLLRHVARQAPEVHVVRRPLAGRVLHALSLIHI